MTAKGTLSRVTMLCNSASLSIALHTIIPKVPHGSAPHNHCPCTSPPRFAFTHHQEHLLPGDESSTLTLASTLTALGTLSHGSDTTSSPLGNLALRYLCIAQIVPPMLDDYNHRSKSASDDANDTAGDAAAYNQRVLRKLAKAIERQPDLDLSSALPPQYQSKLTSKKRRTNLAEGCMAYL